MSSTPPVELLDDGELSDHYETVIMSLLRGFVTPVLGAGASLYGRPPPPAPIPAPAGGDGGEAVPPQAAGTVWDGAPSAYELAEILVREFEVKDASRDLLEIAQWVYALRGGSGGLYDALHTVFDRDFPPTGLHDFLADVPGKLRRAERGKPPLIVTTNYDDLMEKALEARGETYDLIVYMAEGPHGGTFCHVTPDGGLVSITDPETYLAVDPDQRTVVLKMHGFVCRRDADDDSYVITEDHYIEYLSRTDIKKQLPALVVSRLMNTNLLFLGYSLRDWNFRAILYQIHKQRLHDNDWWSIQLRPNSLERKSWEKRNVEIIDRRLEEYIPALERALSRKLGPQPADQS